MTNMEIKDSVYGTFHITDPLLVELLTCSAVTRLKGIHQAGASYLVRAGRDNTRFDHVVGVMLIIRSLGGSVEEQAAGILHDVSHTAFSHVVDQVYQRRGEDFHELHFQRLIASSDIPSILQRHGYACDDILDIDRWSLLEQPAPDLCADRVDYTLRDLLRTGIINHTEIEWFTGTLKVCAGRIVVTSSEAAVWFAKRYVDEVQRFFMNPLEIYANVQLGHAIRLGLEKAILSDDDLFTQDIDVLEKLRVCKDPEVGAYLSRLRMDTKVVEDEQWYEVHSRPKARVVDPLLLTRAGDLVRASDIEPALRPLLAQVVQRAEHGVFVRHVSNGE